MTDFLFGAPEPGLAVGEALIAAGLIDEAGARRARQAARASGQSMVAVAHQLGLADDERVVAVLAERFAIPRADKGDAPTAAVELRNISPAFLRSKNLLPLGWVEDRLLVGVIDPEPSDGLAALAFAAGCAAEPRLMSVSEQRHAFDALYGAPVAHEGAESAAHAWTDDANRLRDHNSATPTVRLVDALLDAAIEANASDIHIEPLPDRVRIRFRSDGALRIVREEPAHLGPQIAARIKVLADMDIADRRSAQDGRTSLAAKGRPIDVRISSVPSAYGETIALRLLRRDPAMTDLAGLGFSPDIVGVFNHVLQMRRGLFLLTGPTGSGKTTTLYAMIEQLRAQALKILSIEDPIEYFFPDITQVQVNEDAGVTFPSALRAFLRQDPDVILIGEIRDSETARIAVQAALTGHLVLATLHTPDAASATARLVDMGVDRFLIAATLAGAASQRLMGRLCGQCRRERAPTRAELGLIAPLLAPGASIRVGEAAGCPSCRQTGVAGRLAAGEGFIVDAALREAIGEGGAGAIAKALSARGFRSLACAAAEHVAAGRVAPGEITALALA